MIGRSELLLKSCDLSIVLPILRVLDGCATVAIEPQYKPECTDTERQLLFAFVVWPESVGM